MEQSLDEATVKTLEKFQEIASDPCKQIHLVKDQANVQFLVYVLEDNNPNIVLSALQTLLLLTQRKELCLLMMKTYGVFEIVESFYNRKHDDSAVMELVSEIYSNLNTAREKGSETQSSDSKKYKPSPLSLDSKQPHTYFLGVANKKAKTLIFQIDGLISKEYRTMCEDELLQVKGIISFTFNMIKRQCILRVKADLEPRLIAQAISRTNVMSAEQLIKDSNGEEKLISFDTSQFQRENETTELPEYLPEEDSPVSDKALTRSKGFKEATYDWLNSATSFLTRSFYW